MSEWITDRLPTKEDADGLMVYGPHGKLCYFTSIATGEAWKPIPKCEPYVKPKRYTVKWLADTQCWAVMDSHYVATRLTKLNHECDEYREAAEKIAAIYEEVIP